MASSSGRASKTSLKKRLKISDAIDRISNLPDSIICLILSFLRTKESVQTCILSKRWKDLWKDVPSLNLIWNRGEDVEGFERFVIMALLKFQSFNELILSCVEADPFNVSSWLSTAIARNVQVLEVCFYDDGNEIGDYDIAENFIALPGSLFTCSSLTFLDLEGDFLVQVANLVSLPRLECLKLRGIDFECDECVPKLIQGCPVLNSLDIERIRFDNVIVFTVTSTTLRRLRIIATFLYGGVSKLEINAPLLEYLDLGDCVSKDLSIQRLPSLVELHLYDFYHEVVYPQFHCDWFLKLVRALHCLKILAIGRVDDGKFSEVFSAAAACASEKFLSLRKLIMMVGFFEWKNLLRVLECSIHLEVLDLRLYRFQFSGATFQNHVDVPRCLSSSLRRMLITVLCRNELEMIKYFLKHGGLLKRVELYTTEGALGFDGLRKILTFSRKSDACEVHVHAKKLIVPIYG